jgi:hypothetical protein
VRLKLRPVATGEGTTEDWITSKLSRDERLESFAAIEERSAKIQEGEDQFNGVRGHVHEQRMLMLLNYYV